MLIHDMYVHSPSLIPLFPFHTLQGVPEYWHAWGLEPLWMQHKIRIVIARHVHALNFICSYRCGCLISRREGSALGLWYAWG